MIVNDMCKEFQKYNVKEKKEKKTKVKKIIKNIYTKFA